MILLFSGDSVAGSRRPPGRSFFADRPPACAHDMMIPAVGLLEGRQLPPYTHIFDLEQKLRCRECDARDKAVVCIKWAELPDRKSLTRMA
jgi:hypothetical protein